VHSEVEKFAYGDAELWQEPPKRRTFLQGATTQAWKLLKKKGKKGQMGVLTEGEALKGEGKIK